MFSSKHPLLRKEIESCGCLGRDMLAGPLMIHSLGPEIEPEIGPGMMIMKDPAIDHSLGKVSEKSSNLSTDF